jgi:short-subunit dehydrogenase
MPTALITGASSGIGAAFARQLAAAGYHLVLVARDGARLSAAGDALTRAGAPAVEVLVADLTDPAARALVAARLDDPDRPIDLLVNNAGIGLGRSFAEVSEGELVTQLELNVTAVLLLTKAALPAMTARRSGAVINVASIAGLVPNPGASYAGTKAWVVAFTEGLAITLRGSGVRVQALCPGLVRTDFHRRAGIDLGRTPSATYLSVDTVVARSLTDLRRGRVISVPGALYRILAVAPRLLPRPLTRALAARAYAVRGN